MKCWTAVRGAVHCAGLTIALVAVLGLGTAGANPGPQTRLVAEDGVAESGDCTEVPCTTIQYAVDEANAGDTVQVAAGTYEEAQIVVDKPLSLEGAGAGETIVDGSTSTGQPTSGLLLFQAPAAGDISVSGFTFEGANGENASGEARIMLFESIPADSDVEVFDNDLITNETLDPDLGEDWSLGIHIAASEAEFDIGGNLFEGMWQGILAERSTGSKFVVGNEFANLTGNEEGSKIWPAEGILLLAVGEDLGAGEVISAPQFVIENSFHDYAGLGVAVQSGHPSAIPTTPNSFEAVIIGGNEIDLEGAIFPRGDRPLGGIVLKTEQDESTIEDPAVLGNSISVTAPGKDVVLEGEVDGAEVRFNRLVGDPAAGLDASLAGPVDATQNWWGCNAGADQPGCTAVSGDVDTTPNLILTASASRTQLQPGQTATISASLLMDSDGGTFEEGFPFPDRGSPVLFAGSLGSLAPPSAALLDGVASSTFTAGSQPGDAGVTVSLDGEQVAVPLQVLAPPVEVGPAPSPTPQPEPPKVTPVGGGAKPVPGNGQVTVATVGCPAGTCKVAVKQPQAKIGGKAFKVRVKLPAKVGAGKTAAIKVVLPKAAREALTRQGKGKVTLKITVTSSTGATKTVTVSVKLKAKKQGKVRG
jgi:hypothetical protein